MIDIHIPASLEYNTANAGLLATALKNLHSFDEIAEWNKKATAEVEAMHPILRAIEEKQQKVTLVLSQEQQEHEAKPFLTKLFDGRKEQKRWLAEQSRLAREKAHIENLIDQFESAIDFTPGSLDELKELMEECKQQKIELLTEKKTVNDQMSSIRVRLNKESALRPQESQKAAIKRQIIQLDQIIIWLERIE
jgi:chromosome segregation ATPase